MTHVPLYTLFTFSSFVNCRYTTSAHARHQKMYHLTTLLVASLFTAPALCKTLYISHYDGHVYTLNFDASNPDPDSSLTLVNTLQTCGSMPSWLELDAPTGLLYCVDESGTSQTSGNGSLTALDVTAATEPVVIAETETLAGGVASVIYGAGDDEKFIAIAH